MGIDVYLKWRAQTPAEAEAQEDAYLSLDGGSVGYLRESYSGGPYGTKILCREAFESASREAEIPSAVLRERLTSVTEPARGFDAGHHVTEQIADQFAAAGGEVRHPGSGRTDPMTVEEAVRIRYDDRPELAAAVVRSFRDFVELAERKELESGRACTVKVAC
jgi:hypothetical protein